MLGYIEFDADTKTLRLARRKVLGGTFLTLHFGQSEAFPSLRAARAARQMRRYGVRRAVFPVDFPYTSAFLHQGVLPIDPLPLRRALCADFVCRRMEQLGIPTTRAVIAIGGDRMTPEMTETVKRLARAYRYVMLAVPEGGEDLAASLRREYGIALILKPARDQLERADALVLFSPREDLSGENRVFCPLYHGGTPLPLELNGAQGLPPNCDREQLAAALYAMGLCRMDTLLEEISC